MLSEGRTVIGGTAMPSCKGAQTQREVTWFKDEKKLSASSEVHEETQGHAQWLVVQQTGKADPGEHSSAAGGRKVSLGMGIMGASTESIRRR